jgi:dihydrofolate reductase
MAKLVYAALASLDGYIEDADGGFAWAEPNQEVHRFANDLEKELGTYLYGRKMYEVMSVWEEEQPPDRPAYEHEFGEIWRAADKIVYSRTLEEASTARTRIEREFDPEAVRRMKEEADRDLGVSGPNLAASAFRAGLVDECHLLLWPVIIGGGKPALPDGVRLNLELVDQRRFGNGVVHLHHRVAGAPDPGGR